MMQENKQTKLLNSKVLFHILLFIVIVCAIAFVYISDKRNIEQINTDHYNELKKYEQKIDSFTNINDSLKLAELKLRDTEIIITNVINNIDNEKTIIYLNDANVHQLMAYFTDYLSKSDSTR